VIVGLAAVADRPRAAPDTPSVRDLFAAYRAWLDGSSTHAATLVGLDLGAVQKELDRLGPSYLMPVQGLLVSIRGRCPSLTLRVGRTTVETDGKSRFQDAGCKALTAGATVRVVRRMDGSAERVQVLPAPAPGGASGAGAFDEAHRELLATFALEIAEAGSFTDARAATRLVEWACARVRVHVPPNGFDRAWQTAALDLIEGDVDPAALAGHLGHVRAQLDDEPRLALARAIAAEQMVAPVEETAGGAGASAAGGTGVPAAPDAKARQLAEDALSAFEKAAAVPAVSAEARVRAAHVALGLGRADRALALLAEVDAPPGDPAVAYLAELFRGLAEERLGRTTDAQAAYRAALAVSPGAHSATVRLAALEFQHGQRPEAGRLVAGLLHDDEPGRDPWWAYYAGDFRFWYRDIARLRRLVRSRNAGSPGPGA
jgi:hypothetical protein